MNDVFKLNFDKLYKNIDWAETFSNLLGMNIKKVNKDSVVLINDNKEEKIIKTNYKEMDNDEINFWFKTAKEQAKLNKREPIIYKPKKELSE